MKRQSVGAIGNNFSSPEEVGKMKDIIITIIFILLLLTAIASAYAQEAWYEAAESSCAGYRVNSTTSKEIKEVRLDEDIEELLEEMHADSNFVVKEKGSTVAGVAGK